MLKFRSSEKEQMDNLTLKGKALHDTLDGLSLINRYLGNTNATFAAVKKEIINTNRPLKIIDLGCGGGDNLRAIADWSNEKKYTVDLIGIDGNAAILEYAIAKNNSIIQIDYLQADILDPAFLMPKCDLLISSHFMYHFSDEALVKFLFQAKEKVAHKIIFSELQRSAIAYNLFRLGSVFLPFSKMVKQDGLKAIRRSFKKKELESIFNKAGIENYKIQRKWVFRYLVEIFKQPQNF